MKFFDYFRLPHVRILSVVFGVISAAPLLLFFDWRYAVLVGASITLLTSLVMPILLYREDRGYQLIKKEIKKPFFIDERVRFTIEQGSIGGYLVLTDSNLILLSTEKGKHRLELTRSQISKIVVGEEQISLRIYVSNTQFIQVFSGACQEMYRILLEKGWGAGL